MSDLRAGPATRPRALLAVASIAIALAAADTYVVVLALTDMMAGVGLGIDALQKATPIISGFLLGYVAVLPLVGRLADLLDRQRVLIGCLAIFVAGSAVTALAVELPVLIVGRLIQGVGGGGLVPATLAIVAALWPADRRGLPLGVVGAVQELGSVLGPVLGALILTIADWRMIFWLNAVLGLALVGLIALVGSPADSASRPWVGGRMGRWVAVTVAVVLWWLTLDAPEVLATSVTLGIPFIPLAGSASRVATPIGVIAFVLTLVLLIGALRRARSVLARADLPGALLLGGILGCVILTFAAADPAREVVGPLGYALLPLAVLLAVVLAVHLRRARHPVIPRGLVRGPALWALVVSACVGAALVAIVVDIPLLARLVHTDSEVEAALILVRFLVAVPFGALLGGWALRRLGDGVVTVLGMALSAVALFAMATWGRGALEHWDATVVLLAAGFGIGLTLAPVNNAALAVAPEHAHGTASALVVIARMVGMVVGLALLTAIGLHQYYQAVAEIPDPSDTTALVDAAILQVHWVLRGAGITAAVGALAASGLGLRRRSLAEPAPLTVGL